MKFTCFYSLLTAILVLSSCSSVLHVYVVDSKNTNKESDMFVYEDDTVKVLYNFWEDNGRMTFAILNKLDKPITVDWKKSMYIQSGVSYPYWGSAYSSGFWGSRGFWGVSSFQSSSVVTRDDETTFLPPKTWIDRHDFMIDTNLGNDETSTSQIDQKIDSLAALGLLPLADRKALKKKMLEEANGISNGNPSCFEHGESPIQFRNYISISVGENANVDLTLDNSFEVRCIRSKVVKKRELSLSIEKEKSGQCFFTVEKGRH
jgi:hypothetical protein